MHQFIAQNPWIIGLLALWVIPWKGVALWKSAQRKEMKWFIVLLIVNTLAILDIIYVVFFSKRENNKLTQ